MRIVLVAGMLMMALFLAVLGAVNADGTTEPSGVADTGRVAGGDAG